MKLFNYTIDEMAKSPKRLHLSFWLYALPKHLLILLISVLVGYFAAPAIKYISPPLFFIFMCYVGAEKLPTVVKNYIHLSKLLKSWENDER